MVKIGYIRNSTMRKYLSLKKGKINKLKTNDRQSLIFSGLMGKNVKVYNGWDFLKLNVTEKHIGLPLGDFILTRRKVKHKGKRKKVNVVQKKNG